MRDHLFDPSFNRWCEYSHNGQCAYIGVYQPRLPEGPDYGNFVLLGNYVKLFSMLQLPRTTNLREFAARADAVCGGEDEPAEPWHREANLDDYALGVALLCLTTLGLTTSANFILAYARA